MRSSASIVEPRGSRAIEEMGASADGPSVGTRAMMARLEERLFDVQPPLIELGRYAIRRKIGSGAMGVVYEAYDPALGRRLAIKVVRSGNTEARMLREARNLARLNHPNVVTIVDVGMDGDQLFIAMEYVEGGTLLDWCRTHPHGTPGRTRALVDFALQAARGLTAAHRRGIMHRDFKPANVLIDGSGRLRVADFGLARANDGMASIPSLGDNSTGEGPATGESGLDVVGTPAYMAPEQFSGQYDARADQFAWAVTFYEALFGRRPYPGDTVASLRESVARGRLEPPPRWKARRVGRVLQRALAVDPTRRFASMDAAIEALERRASMRTWAIAGTVLFIAGAAALASGGEGEPDCEAVAAALDEHWSAEARTEVERALTENRGAFGRDTWTRVEAQLDDYVERWSAARLESCRSSADLDAPPLRCLRAGQRSFVALVDALHDPDATMRALEAARSLPDLAQCHAAADGAPSPALDAARDGLARAAMAGQLGRHEVAREEATRVLALAEAADEPGLALEALEVQAGALEGLDEFEASEAILRDAYFAAVAQGDDRAGFRLALDLVFLVGERLRRGEEGAQWLQHAESRLELIDDPSDEDRAAYLEHAALVDMHADRWQEAVSRYQEAIAITPDAGRRVMQLGNLSDALAGAGRQTEALEAGAASLRLAEETFGPQHPKTTFARGMSCGALLEIGRGEEAEAACRRTLEDRQAVLGPTHHSVAEDWANLGAAQGVQGEFEASVESLTRARELLVAMFGEHHPDVATADQNLGQSLMSAGRVDDGLAALRRAVEARRGALGEGSPELARAELMLGLSLVEVGRHADAAAPLEAAVPVLERAMGAGAFAVLLARAGLANVRLRTGDIADALVVATAAEVALDGATPPSIAAYVHFVLAQALAQDGAPDRALDHAHRARALYVDAGPGDAKGVESVDAWLQTHADDR